MFVNLIILKLSTKYHYSSTIVNGIVHAQKLGKKSRQRPGVANVNLNTAFPN